MSSPKNIIGKTFGRLKVEEYLGKSKYKCVCECGSYSEVLRVSLIRGNTKSCGCLRKEVASATLYKHGKRFKPIYKVWLHMKDRCYNPNNNQYKNYGERGIEVCKEWLDSFENFYKDMGDKPEGLSIDRVDVNGHYCKANCRWADDFTQAYNQRKRSDNTSGKSGVSYDKIHGKWIARISYKGKRISLGRYKTKQEAIEVREKAEIKYYGSTKE